jgi:hypothetical protein
MPEIDRRRPGAPRRKSGESFHDLSLDRRPVDVADDDDGHQFRAVPRVVEAGQRLAAGFPDDAIQADREPLGHAGARLDELKLRDKRPVAHRVPGPFLAQDDPALLLDQGGLDQQAPCVVGQDPQAVREGRGGRVGKLELINRAVKRGGCVRIGAGAHAQATELLGEGAGRIVRAPVEGHVLEEVREPPLRFGLAERAGEHQEAH